MYQQKEKLSASSSENHPAMRILLINPPNSGRSILAEEYGIDSFNAWACKDFCVNGFSV